ncbi:MAG: hypothetical protein N2258_00300 [Brevinematales bacterium]|nr:hypothetical protein [Brevinematales bacterium]
MKKLISFFILLFSFGYSSDLLLTIDFEKTSFRLNSPMNIEIKIINTSQERKIIKLSPLDYESFHFYVRTIENELLDYKDDYRLKTKEIISSADDVKEVLLFPGESISRIVDLDGIFDFRKVGFYYLKVNYYPDPENKLSFYESENYKFLIKPPLNVEDNLKKVEDTKQKRIDIIKKSPPYEIVEDLIDAKMKKDWDRFLVYFDLERLIYSFQNFGSAYENAKTGKHKFEILEDFRRYLTTHWQDRILSYKILEAYIKEGNATVDADVEFKVRNLSYVLRYTFKFYKNSDNEWKIYDYTVLRVK